jgi:phospholipase C
LLALGVLAGLRLLVARVRCPASHRGIHKICHVVVIMEENRSFDSFFGTYPTPTGSR